jgi:fructokinase
VIHLSDGTTITHDGYRVKATDTTGAGDSFVAGMLTGILAHPEDYVEHLPSILDLANGIGALTTLQKGAIPSLPTMAQAKAFIAERKA